MSDQSRICLVSASGQNVFFAEILEAFGEALRERGFAVEESTDCFPAPADDLVYLYVPHEFHHLVDELAHPTRPQLRRSVAVCTEQPGTKWFELGSAIAAEAGGVVDINVLGKRELVRRGIAAEHVSLGYVPAWDAWRGREDGERSIDLTFLGGHTDRRARALARCAPALTGRRASIHLTETTTPHAAGTPSFLAHDRKWRLLADAKVILNVHRGELPYMEWHRVIGALLNGCVVLSEHSLGVEPLVPGEHFVSSNYEMLPAVLEGLLGDPERIRGIRQAAYALVRDQMPQADTVDGLVGAIERAARNPVPADGQTPPAAVPLPRSPQEPDPGWEADADFAGEALPVRTALKHLVIRTRALERQIAGLAASGQPDRDIVERLGPERADPRVSVLLTVYNYADHLGEALRSTALSDLREIEVVAVDDASTDGSVEAVRSACAELPWLSVKHVRRQRNHGLPASRNLAAEHASADLLFVLDADNQLLPAGLGRLAQALGEHPDAAFAYGIIECFDVNGPSDLLNWLDWDPARLRLGNYIDAMAMVRRSALEAVGGYSTDPALYGWEDFDVWVGMANRGMHGVRVPDFVARYRRSLHSMIALANIDSLASWSTLLRKHPILSRGEAAHQPSTKRPEVVR
jgi:hypothetical protein